MMACAINIVTTLAGEEFEDAQRLLALAAEKTRSNSIEQKRYCYVLQVSFLVNTIITHYTSYGTNSVHCIVICPLLLLAELRLTLLMMNLAVRVLLTTMTSTWRS